MRPGPLGGEADGADPDSGSKPEGDRAACDGMAFTMEGQKFIVFRFGAVSIMYNIATGLWNLATTGENQSWQVMGSAFRTSV